MFKMLMKKFCPKCSSEDIELAAGGTTGTFICKNCGFSGSIFPEKPIVGLETAENKQEKNNDAKTNRRR